MSDGDVTGNVTGGDDRREARALEQVRTGDAEAFGQLVELHQDVAFRAAYLVVRDAQAAEDVAQEAFVRAYQQLHRFDASRPFRPWLLRIVTNLALNETRARGRRRGLLERAMRATPWPPRASEGQPEREAVAGDERAGLLRAIDELREEDRVVLYLRYFLDLPEVEIAVAIEQRPGTVKSRLSRARGRLQAVIEAGYPELIPDTAMTPTGADVEERDG